MSILITGANGFIGQQLTNVLLDHGYSLLSVLRLGASFNARSNVNIKRLYCFDEAHLRTIDFTGIECVVHLAAKAHVSHDDKINSLELFRIANVESTLNLARLAANAGVKRFVFLSSIGVNGTSNNKPFCVTDEPAPSEPYAWSKLEAEKGLRQIALDTGIEVVIIRPPLVYGANAPGNFGRLIKLVQKDFPLPLGAIFNKRSLVGLDNLIDLIVTCVSHPKAGNQTFLVSDDHDLSTTELLNMMAKAAGKRSRLVPIPVGWLKFTTKLIRKQAVIDRLCGNLQVDIRPTKETLDWVPPISVEEGIRRCFIKEDLC